MKMSCVVDQANSKGRGIRGSKRGLLKTTGTRRSRLKTLSREKRMYRRSLNPPSRSAKTKVIRVPLSEAEYQRLKALSRKKKLNVSVLVRYYIGKGVKEENVLHEM